MLVKASHLVLRYPLCQFKASLPLLQSKQLRVSRWAVLMIVQAEAQTGTIVCLAQQATHEMYARSVYYSLIFDTTQGFSRN